MSWTRRRFAAQVGTAALASIAVPAPAAPRPPSAWGPPATICVRDTTVKPAKPLTETLSFLEHCHQLTPAASRPASDLSTAYAKAVAPSPRVRHGFEASGPLPNDDTEIDGFRDFCKAARTAGAKVIRTVLFPGRRYENHDSKESFEQARKQAWKKLTLAEPTLRKMGLKAGVENHKNLRIPDMLDLLHRLQSDYVGVTVDFGNNYVLMEDPVDVAKAFAPYAFSSHIKDHILQEYEHGFLLFDAALGEGVMDLRQIVDILRGAQPGIRVILETMTRDALEAPWMTEKYWATFGPDDLPGRDLARTVMTVKRTQPKEPLPKISALSVEEQLRLEDDNNRKGLAYARQTLGL